MYFIYNCWLTGRGWWAIRSFFDDFFISGVMSMVTCRLFSDFLILIGK